MRRPLFLVAIVLAIRLAAVAQTKEANSSAVKATPASNISEKTAAKSAREAEAERLLKERRANAQSLLISLAADARSFNDMVTRGRTLARIASVLWNTDRERARSMFRLAWDAAEVADKDTEEHARNQAREMGNTDYWVPLPIRGEVIRLAARRDGALGEEFMTSMKEDMRRENGGVQVSTQGTLGIFDPLIRQRLDAARNMLEAGEVERAVQFFDPVIGMVGQETVDFLSSVRERNAAVADERYAAMLAGATTSQLSDANTVSLLASYLFTPHTYIGYSADGIRTNSYPGNRTPPEVSPELRLAFFRAAAAILLRPVAAPGEDQTTAGQDGRYLVIKRLLPVFEQYGPPELTASLKAQLETLSPLVAGATRDRDDDDWVRKGIRPDNQLENWEKQLTDQLDHAKDSAERDKIYLQLASLYAGKSDLRARDFIDEVADPETRKNGRIYIDIRLARSAVAQKDLKRIMELTRTGELDHVYRSWLFAQAAGLSLKSDNQAAAGLVDSAIAEARRISPSVVDAPRAFVAAANAAFAVNRAVVWETMDQAITSANAAEKFSGEGGELVFSFTVQTGPSYASSQKVPEFDLEGIFGKLADYDYDKAVQLARGLNRDATRSVATIAIARSVLEQKQK
ncbi:MAG TPA: hypothetical protein VE961_03160 [Pyrinomonadaceae bacterium]|nr:hypothetical protein [Pyrinomonadaceae bacterium]